MNQHSKAEPLYQRSLKILISRFGPDHPNVALSLNNLAVLHAATEQWSEAVAETERSRRIIRHHVAGILPALSEQEQLIFLNAQHAKEYSIALSLGLRRLADPEAVLRSAGWVLNGKAVAQEVLAQRAVLTAEVADPALADLMRQLLAVRRELASLSLTVPKTGQEADYRRQGETLDQEEQEISRQLGRASGHNAAGDPWVELAAVRKSLAKDAVLIDIARFPVWSSEEAKWLPPHYVAWIIPADGGSQIAIVDLGEAQPIDEVVQKVRKAIEEAATTIRTAGEAEAEKQLCDVMRSLTRMLLEPLESHLGEARQVILSPDGALWLVPWGTLPLPDARYAVEKYQICYSISGRDVINEAPNNERKTTSPILFANPDYDLGPRDADVATRAVLRREPPGEQVTSSRGIASLGSLTRSDRFLERRPRRKPLSPMWPATPRRSQQSTRASTRWRACSRRCIGRGCWC